MSLRKDLEKYYTDLEASKQWLDAEEQIRKANEQRLAATELARIASEKSKKQPEFDRLTADHEENVRYVQQLAELAQSHISSSFTKFQNRLAGKYPVVLRENSFYGFELKPNSLGFMMPNFGNSPRWDGTEIQYEPRQNFGSLHTRFIWGNIYPEHEHRGGHDKIPMLEADYSFINIYINFDARELESFSVLSVDPAGTIPSPEWQKNPNLINELIERALLKPEIVRYDREKYSVVPNVNGY